MVDGMATSKHRKTRPGEAPRDDLVDNPGTGIGASKGTGVTGLDPRQVGRTNE